MSESGKIERDRIAKLLEIKDPKARRLAMKNAGFGVVNKPPEWPYWNRVATVTQHNAICLSLNLDPRSFYSNNPNMQRYREILDIAGSHIANGSLRYLNRSVKTFRVTDWLLWLQRTDIPVPEGWRPIGLGLELDDQRVFNDGPFWTEAVDAALMMRDDPKVQLPRTQQQLYEYMLRNRGDFPNCCPASVQNFGAIAKRVYRERECESLKNPLKDPRFLQSE